MRKNQSITLGIGTSYVSSTSIDRPSDGKLEDINGGVLTIEIQLRRECLAMTRRETREIAELIALRMEQGWESQATRLWERALQDGIGFRELEDAIFEARYGERA